ncbi:MAG: prolyl oligopeptidase family serine peptidase, partial [Alicyclobacillus sp.]|nr:prolyl oligopeptidase family serine peptidase [Alicyclobacillus sp.]
MKRYHCCATCKHFRMVKEAGGHVPRCIRLGYETRTHYQFRCWTPRPDIREKIGRDVRMLPPLRTVPVTDNYHGHVVADPFRWLENQEDPDTQAFVAAQDDRTFAYVRSLPQRPAIYRRLSELWNYVKVSGPGKAGSRYTYFKNDGLQNQAVLYIQDDVAGEARVLLDPNGFSEDGTVALTNVSFSHVGRYLAYAVSQSGSDRQEIRVLDVETGEALPDIIRWCKFTHAAWTHDGRGFYYSRFPEPGTVAPEDESNYSQVYWHTLGTEQSEDVLVYERPDQKEWTFHPLVTEDGQYLVLWVSHGTDTRNRIYYRALADDGSFVRLLDDFDAKYDFIGNQGHIWYFLTNLNAPNGRIIAIDLHRPSRSNWREVVAEGEHPIAFAALAGGRLVLGLSKQAHHELVVHELDGRYLGDVPLPGLGSVVGLHSRADDPELLLSFTSYLQPVSILRYDLEAGVLQPWFTPEVPFDASDYETRQVFYPSRDGTMVSMFITHKKGLALDGRRPTLLYGYGGFFISEMPVYRVPPLVLLEQGGVYATVNLRGGSEYGEDWHRAGMLDQKQHVFDDFISAAEWLCQNGYTNPSKLAINGRSNGGLLVSACMVQRPDLFGVVLCDVPVTDMLRYHKFTVGRFWIPEYGNAEANHEHFHFLIAYSPLHNVQKGVQYPPVLITTADTDDRVVPAHSFKLTATLQANAANPEDVYLRVETKAGHGFG